MPPNHRVLFIGSKKLGLKCLETINTLDGRSLIGVATIDDSNDSRSNYQQFKIFCKKENLKLYTVNHKNQFNDMIKNLKPDLVFVIGWYQIIDTEILSSVPMGFIGIHGSLLPEYRGGAPLVWAIINGEKNAGVSLFSLTREMDDGPIWGQKKFQINFTDYIEDILKKAEESALYLLKQNYLKILNKTKKPKPQSKKQRTYCALRSSTDGLINWRESATKIYNFIRAQSEPYPGAFTYFENKKITIWRGKPSKLIFFGTPGQVTKISSEGVCVICGDNKPLILENIEVDGKKFLAQDYFHSIKTRFK